MMNLEITNEETVESIAQKEIELATTQYDHLFKAFEDFISKQGE